MSVEKAAEKKDVKKPVEELVYTINPRAGRFLFEPRFDVKLNIHNPHYEIPKDFDEDTKELAKMWAEKAVENGVLLRGRQTLVIKGPEVSESTIDAKTFLDKNISAQVLKQKLITVCKSDTEFLDNGKVRSAANDLEALLAYEQTHLNRPMVIDQIKRALNGEYGSFTGGISSVTETKEKRATVPTMPQSASPDQKKAANELF